MTSDAGSTGSVLGRGVVTDLEGISVDFVEVADDLSPDEVRAAITFANGRRVLIPRTLMLPQEDGKFFVPLSLSALAGQPLEQPPDADHVIPLAKEEVRIGKRSTATAKVRVTKHVQEREQIVDLPLVKESVEIRHVSVERWIDTPATVRQEGDTTILPVMEEVLVVEKRLRLVEEVHVVKHRDLVQRREAVTLRRETAQVEKQKLSGETVGEGNLPHRPRN